MAGHDPRDGRNVGIVRPTRLRGFVTARELEPAPAAIDEALEHGDIRTIGRHASEELSMVIENPARPQPCQSVEMPCDIGPVELHRNHPTR
jgi:hypothetical protein